MPSQRLPSYWGFSYLGYRVSLHGSSSKVQRWSGGQPRRDNLHPRSAAVAGRRYPTFRVSDSKELLILQVWYDMFYWKESEFLRDTNRLIYRWNDTISETWFFFFNCCCCWSVPKLCLTFCDPMDCSTPGFPVLHYLLEFAQTHVHWVSNAIQPSHPLLSPSPPAFSLSQHRGLFQWVGSSIRWPKCWRSSFSISLSNEYSGVISLGWTGLISLQSTGLSRVFSNTRVPKYQFFSAQPSLWSNSHIHTWLPEKP